MMVHDVVQASDSATARDHSVDSEDARGARADRSTFPVGPNTSCSAARGNVTLGRLIVGGRSG
jgi:hypothetical protein